MMRYPSFVPTRQRGVALIMAVLIVALATILAISVASEGYMDQRRTSTAIVLDQAFEVALGAEAGAAYLLSQDKNLKADTPDEDWAMRLPPQVIDEGVGEFTGYLEDLQGRFNLNNVLNKDGSKNVHGVRQFQNLLVHLKLDPRYATRMLDWVDVGNSPDDPQDGAEDTVYAAQTPAYLTANMVITRTSELMSILGMTPQEYLRLEPYVAALPAGTPLNVCTAAAIVIDSLDEPGTNDFSGDLAAFDKNRSTAGGCFPAKSNLTTIWAGTAHKNFNDTLQNPDALSETTSFFRATIVVTIGTTELALYSTLYRATPGANGKTRVIQRSIGTT